jgi:diguanylate cyclase
MSEFRKVGIEDEKADKLTRSVWRTLAGIGLAYSYDAAVLFGFFFAGFVSLTVPILFVILCASLFGAVGWAHGSGWSRRLSDRTLFLPQQLFAISIALTMALMAPQIGFQPMATLLAISAFSFMAPNTISLFVSWSAGALGAVAVIFLVGPRLAMPTSTLAGQALTSAVIIGLLARCIWIATFFLQLRLRLKEKNIALKSAMERIEAMADRDDLTGLPNRRSIAKWLDEQIAVSARTGLPLSVAILDIDHFKAVNDTYGHLAGDRTLQIFARVASAAVRTTDRLGRYGGEEFLVVLVGTELANAKAPLERIRNALAMHSWDEIDEGMRVTITVGATQYLRGESVEALIRRADMALYLGKEAGRDRVVLDHTLFAKLGTQAPFLTTPLSGNQGGHASKTAGHAA